MMKKWCLLCLCLLMLLGSLAACKKKPSTGTPDGQPDTSAVETDPSGNGTSPENGDGSGTTATTKKNGWGWLTFWKKTTTTTVKQPAGDNTADLDWDDMTPNTTTTTTRPATTTTAPVKEQDGVLLPVSGSKLLPEGAAGRDYLVLGQVSHSGNVVTLEVCNTSKGYETEQEKSTISYACYDKNGKVLQEDTVNFGRVYAGKSATVKITMPNGTAKLAITGAETEFWTQGWH